MLSPRYLEGISDELVEIYSQLETDILCDMARRIARLGKITDATEWQARILAEAGGLKQDIGRILAKYDKAVTQQVKDVVTAAMEKNTANDNRVFKAATGRTVGAPSAQQMLATIQKCRSDLSRLTLTTAATSQQLFFAQANRAHIEVQSGAFDYDTALKHAVNNMASRGVTTVQYQNGKPVTRTIEAAVRTNILTGINHTASTITINNCEELGCDLVEVSAHIGARDRDGPNPWSNHEAWQGKIYKLNGSTDKYPNFYDTCGYGEADGICGINCRHSFYPYFEGSEARYSKDELDDMKDKEVEYNGQKMSRYEAEQHQRGIERNIRKYKRLAETQDAANIDNTQARQKIGEWQARARDFTKQTGLQREYTREYIGTKDGKQPAAVKPKVIKSLSAISKTVPQTPPRETHGIEPKSAALKKATDMKGLVDSPKTKARNILEMYEVAQREVFVLDKPLEPDRIIARVGGGDKTAGSCSSAALAYAANRAGFDVLDFRGGMSRSVFADRTTMSEIAGLNGVKSRLVTHSNDFMAMLSLQREMETGKEYYLAIGRHAAIVRKMRDEVFEYLELQENDIVFNSGLKLHVNGFKKLTDDVLKKRFRCTSVNKTDDGMRFESLNILIDIESLGKSREFVELMKYINTSESGQLKGQGGYAK